MEDDGAERRAAHARVGDPEHVLHARPCQLGRNGQVSRFGHPGANRPRILQHQRIVWMHVQIRIVDAGREIVEILEDDRSSDMLEETLVSRSALEDRPVRRNVAEQGEQPSAALKRIVHGTDDRTVDKAGAMPQAFLERLPGDRATRQMQERLELLEHCGDAAGRMEVLHVVLARRFEVHEDRGGLAEAVQMTQVDGQSDATRNGREVNDGIGGAPDGQQHPERILDRFTRHDLIQSEARRRQPDRLHPRGLRNPEAVRMHRGDSGASRQADAERFRQARHRAGGAHHGTGARRHRQVVFDFHDLRFRHFAGAVAGPEAAAIGACAKPFASIPSRHHRSHDKLNRGNRRRHGPHDLRGARLVAAADQHHRAHGLGPDHFLDVHRHQIAKHEARGTEEDLTERDGRKVEGQAARRPGRRA